MSEGDKYINNNDEMEETPKSKLIIISKNGKLGKSSNQTFTLKNEDGRMEFRFDNISESITKRKIDKTLQSLIYNKSFADFPMNKKKINILDYNASTEKEKNDKNEKIKYCGKYDSKKFRIIEEKIKNLDDLSYKKEKPKDINIIIENNETINNNSNIKENANNNNNTYIDESNNKKDDIIFIKNTKEINHNKNNITKNNLIKNFEEIIGKDENNKEMNTEPNNLKNYKNQFKDILKKNEDKDDEEKEEEDEDCEEDIISYNEKNEKTDNNNKQSSFRDFESNVAIKNDQSERERDNKYIMNSYNENFINFNNYLRGNINNSNSNTKEKILTSHFYISKEHENSEKNNDYSEDGTNRILKEKENFQNTKELNAKNLNELFHTKITSENSKTINGDEHNNKTFKNRVFNGNFNRPSNFSHNLSHFSICKKCTICENTYSSNRIYVAECGIHYLCKKCSKNYFEEQIENGETELHCPFLYCKKNFPIIIMKNFISEEHFRLLQENANKNKMMLAKIKSNISYEKIKLYSKNNVLDINTNKALYNYNKNRDIFCPKCNKDTLFSKANNYFLKCLNCNYNECKYCFKDFSHEHMDANSSKRCKVYFRRNEDYNNINKCLFFLIQLFLVFAIYIMIFISVFLNIKKFFQNIIRISKKGNFLIRCLYIFNLIFAIILSIILLCICSPFIIIWFPFFPFILALSDF